MGLFVHLSGVANSTLIEVEQALKVYASREQGIFEPASNSSLESETLIVKAGKDHKLSLLHWGDFEQWEKVSAFLSEALKSPVILLHIHDSDFWMYLLFVEGQVVDGFNPLPAYWDDSLTTEEREAWRGNSATLCQHWPGVSEAKLTKYLVNWDTLRENVNHHAYPGDLFATGDEWQMLDFMRALGLVYPLSYPFDITGEPLGKVYRFRLTRS